MKEEVKEWIKRSDIDMDSARFNLDGGKYYVAAFLFQQAAEKALKALYIIEHKELWKIHDLVKLGEKLSAPEEIIESCERLTQHYVASRYPVESEYKKEDAEEAFEDSRKVIEWVKQRMQKL